MATRLRRDKGAGSLYQRKADGMWCASVTLPSHDGRRRRKMIVAKTKDAAQAKLRTVMRDLAKNGDLPTSSPTLATWLGKWLDEVAAPRLKPRTLDGYRSKVDQYIVPSIGKVRLDKLTPDHVRQMHRYITDTRKLSSSSALQAHRVLAKALTDAERDGRVTRNVATLVDAPRKAVVERDSLTVEQALTLLRFVSDGPDAPRWYLALFTGMRQGECLGLTREMVDLEARVITVAWELQRLTWKHGCGGKKPCKKRGGNCPQRTMKIPDGQETRQIDGALYLLRPKSRKSWRRVPMAPPLYEVMKRHLDGRTEEFVFTDGARPVYPSDDYRAWIAALEGAGLPKMPLHSARHTTASLLFALGVPEQTRMEILGHSSATVTMGYTHDRDQTLARDAMDKFGQLLTIEG